MNYNRYVFRARLRNRTSLRALMLGLAASIAAAPAAIAQSASSTNSQAVPNTSATSSINLDLGAVLSTGVTTNNGDASIPGTAANEAPSRASLKETQPTSVISQKFVTNNLPPTVNYTDIMNLSPSASSTDNQGPGLDESHHAQLRGFQDGQYNVTFDGIPYGDSNDFTHHSTTFFAAHDVGETIIDRGPGTASTVGDATFGGTVAIVSKDPSASRGITVYGTGGAFSTYMAGAEGDTGSFGSYGTQVLVDGAYSGSHTATTNGKLDRSNVFAKAVQPLGSNFVLTAVAMYNDTYQQYASGATQAEIAAYGSNYGLSGNPLSQNYYGYQTDHYKTDFEYIDLRGTFGDGWTVDSKVYTYAYYHHSLNGYDTLDCPEQGFNGCNLVSLNTTDLGKVNGGTNASGTGVPIQYKFNTYRSVGTISRLQKDFTAFTMDFSAKVGVWYDHQVNTRALIDQNATTGQSDLNIERLMHDSLDTFQPYAELDIRPELIPGLTIKPGVKWNYFKRGIDAPVNQKTLKPLGYIAVYKQTSSSVEANYAVTPDLSVYAQWAQGFLAPNLNALYSIPAELNQSTLKPQTTDNYQAGVVWQSPRLSADADVYYIPFGNLAASRKVNGNAVFYNAGGAIYEGVEGEATYVVGGGVDLYANGSLNSAKVSGSKGKSHIGEAPQATAAGGILFDNGVLNGSILDKWTGGKYGNTGVAAGNPWLDPYNIVDLSAGIDFHTASENGPPVKLVLNVDNVTNQKQIFDYNGTTTGTVNGTQNIFFTLPGISYFLNVTVPLNF